MTKRENEILNKFYGKSIVKSWDGIMLIIEKIESLEYSVKIEENRCRIYLGIFTDKLTIESKNEDWNKFKNTYKALVQFVNWFYKNGKVKRTELSR